MACSNNSMKNQHQLDTITRCSPPPTTTATDAEVATIPTTTSSIGITSIPATMSKQNDLLSRISSFLPQIYAANIELCNIQQQQQQQQQQNENESNQSIQIDQSLLLPVDDDDNDDDDDDTGDDDDSDNDAIDDDDDNDDNQLSHPCKRVKKESTIVMDLHLNQSTNNPLFQALYDDTTPTNDNDSHHDDNDHDEYQEED